MAAKKKIAKSRMGRPRMLGEAATQVAFRVPAELLERLDNHAARMSEQTPGMTFTRADAARILLTMALDEVEKNE